MKCCCTASSDNFKKISNSVKLLNAVTEPTRLVVLCILSNEKICVCDLAKKIGISHNLLSHHLKTLLETNVLEKRRDGNQFFYSIKEGWKERIKHLFEFMGIN